MTLFKGTYAFFKKIVPNDTCQQISDTYYIDKVINSKNINTVLDLGCGEGNSVDYFKQKKPDIRWFGADIESSPEVNVRKRSDAEFITFDGAHLSFKDQELDLIYCHQVLEHVKNPRELLYEIKRVLKPGGFFIGSTSHLEPYHSYSYWNYTPYGFSELISEVGLTIIEIRPGIDAFTLLIRKALGLPKLLNRYFTKETPINKLIEYIGIATKKNINEINMVKLMFCGQFIFFVQRRTKDGKN